MSFNPYIYEQLITARHEEILRDMQQSKIQARASQRRSSARERAARLNLPGIQYRTLRQSGASAS